MPLVRGLRNPADFEFEKSVAQMNQKTCQVCETVFLLTSAGLCLSSAVV